MKILGIAHDIVISSAAIIVDGKIIAACPEERFTRVKQDRSFPHNAIKYCLEESNLKIEELDYISIAWNPSRDIVSSSSHGFSSRRNRVEHFYSVPRNLNSYFDFNNQAHLNSKILIDQLFKNCPTIVYTDHYDCHLFSSFALSGFRESAYGIIDGRAETHTQRLGELKKELINFNFVEQNFPHSLGLFYGAITQLLGYKPDGDEWKVMAMGAYADKQDKLCQEIFKEAIEINSSGKIINNMNLFGYSNHWEKNMYSEILLDKLKIELSDDGKLILSDSRRYEIALSLQNRFEEIMIKIIKFLRNKSQSDNLILSGGCLMNSLFNGKIKSLNLFKDIYIGPFPDDSGTSIGAAYAMHFNAQNNKDLPSQKRCTSNYFGPKESHPKIKEELKRVKIPFIETRDNEHLVELASKDLNKGKVIGWVQGRSEFGQRSLGNRSILLDPRLINGKELINSAIKFRESYRPFAPAILKEYFHTFFEGDPNQHYFMESVASFKKKIPVQVPAVMNNDNTGRVQVVTAESNELFYKLIFAFHKKTDCPIILNTSFNLNGEPVVLKANDAIKTFYSSGIDVLYLERFRITKNN